MKITIPKPCHENWDEMTPDEKGKFCAVCSKSVVDFSKKSEVEVIDYLSSSTEKNICGNFNTNQLNRNLDFSFLNSFLAKFTVGLMLTSGGWVSCTNKQIRGKIIRKARTNPVTAIKDSLIAANSKRDKVYDSSSGKYRSILIFYIFNNNEISEADFNKLDSNRIKSIKVLKEKDAIKKYGLKARDGAIVISSK